ncbi:hypothetical protein SALBM135S_03626 [Streptomyces alboniger]
MTADATGPAAVVHAFRRGEWRPSLDIAALPGPREAPYGLALVPEIVAHADRRWWDTAREALPPPTGRRELLRRAVELFDRGTVTVGGLGEQGPEEFRAALWRTAGLPGPLVDRWCGMLKDGLLERGDAPSADDALALVTLPGNTFTCLDSVLDQAERSAGVWVRPSRREPLSAARLVAALVAAGWPAHRIGLYPGEQHTLHGLVRRTDRQVVYGGAGLAASVRRSPALTLHGPGRGCALVPEECRPTRPRHGCCRSSRATPDGSAATYAPSCARTAPTPRPWRPRSPRPSTPCPPTRRAPPCRSPSSASRGRHTGPCARSTTGCAPATGCSPAGMRSPRSTGTRASCPGSCSSTRPPGTHCSATRRPFPSPPFSPPGPRPYGPSPPTPCSCTAQRSEARMTTALGTLPARLRERVPQLGVGLDTWTRRMMRWHFEPETASPFWAARRATLGFDPLKDVDGFAALELFGLFDKAELRAARARDLRPRGYRDRPFRVFETGGTTGPPCRIVNVTRLAYDVEIYRTVLETRGVPAATCWR